MTAGVSNVDFQKRIEWVDIFKALAIILVVIGHTTGVFNGYIYQFHMAAFFFISGYTVKIDKDTLLHFIYKKIYSLYLPLFSMVILGQIFMTALHYLGMYTMLFNENLPYNSFVFVLKEFLLNANNYVWWLGATWFIIVLCLIEILHKIICTLFKNAISVKQFLVSVCMFLLGYFCVNKGLFGWYCLDLVLIGQFYFYLGIIIRKSLIISENIKIKGIIIRCLLCGLCIFALAFLKDTFKCTVDYPSRDFGNPGINLCSASIGIILLLMISQVLDILTNRCKTLKNGLIIVGKNTLGIIFFHFLFFKAAFGILILQGVVNIDYLRNFQPLESEKQKYWVMISLVAISGSIILWKLILKIKNADIIFGQNKLFFENIWQKMDEKIRLSKGIKNTNLQFLKMKFEIVNYFKKQKYWKLKIFLLIILCVTWGKVAQNSISNEPIDIVFPNHVDGRVIFKDGWLPVTEESYRWIEQEGSFEVQIAEWTTCIIQGFVPDNFTEVNTVKLLIDSTEIISYNLEDERSFEFNVDIEKYQKKKINVNIYFDGIHVPESTESDTRKLSGLISSIVFK
ncbi:MAG: acyltransferase family protein [Lachnospiraceae bacterium]|nr:acyltransferase family protein [Lachnospiraceae bacterium]